MNKIEIFKGENKVFRLTLTTGGDIVNSVALAIIDGMKRRVYTYTTDDDTLVYDGEVYTCELTAEQCRNLRPDKYAIEASATTASGTTIRPLAELEIKNNKMYDL